MSRFETLESRDNARLVKARKVRDGRVDDEIFVEGKRLTAEAVRSGLTVKSCFVSEGFGDEQLVDAVESTGCEMFSLSDKLFDTIADTKNTQGIIVIAQRPRVTLSVIESRIHNCRVPIVIMLDEVNNPLNLGAVMRSAEAAGAAGVITSVRSSDVYSAKALRSSMGSAFRLPVVEARELDESIRWAKERHLSVIAADNRGTAGHTDVDWTRPSLLVFGSEAHGLSDEKLDLADTHVRIEMETEVESLNLAVSAGVILFEARRQTSKRLDASVTG